MSEPTTIPAEREQEIRERAGAATPGPWGTRDDGTGRHHIAADLKDTGCGFTCRRQVALTVDEPIDNDPAHREWDADEDDEQIAADAEFIAHARQDVPTLLAEVDRLRGELATRPARAESWRAAADLIDAELPEKVEKLTGNWAEIRTVSTAQSASELLRRDAAAVGKDTPAGGEFTRVPAIGDHYDSRAGGEPVTVTRLWTIPSGRTAVAFSWRDDKPGERGSALPLDSFNRAYLPAVPELEGEDGPCDCGEGAVHYTAADCPFGQRQRAAGSSPAERAALNTAHAAAASPADGYDLVSVVVSALDSAQLLQSPETAERAERHRVRMVAAEGDLLDIRGALSPSGGPRWVPVELGERVAPAVEWLLARVAELEAERHSTNDALADITVAHREVTAPADVTVWRAQHDSIPMGLYTTREAAKAHCEADTLRDLPGVSLDWIEDEEDGVAELIAAFGEDERPTGYVVTALTVASAYDKEDDE